MFSHASEAVRSYHKTKGIAAADSEAIPGAVQAATIDDMTQQRQDPEVVHGEILSPCPAKDLACLSDRVPLRHVNSSVLNSSNSSIAPLRFRMSDGSGLVWPRRAFQLPNSAEPTRKGGPLRQALVARPVWR